MFTGAQVNLYCDDVEDCAAFYRRLGCAERFRTPATGAPVMVEVVGPGFTIGLASAAAGNDYGLDVAPDRRSTELVFWCDDVEAAYGAARAAGGTEADGPVDSPDGRLRFAWVRDPAGHLLKLVQRLDR
ncbi:VOC family protein [Nocardioides conyzicola]|uniref:VOC domain-containing protein n=1 Tax=Nocardioides conyzicola TaxID=1651781 RepID=A0ABP8WSZ2_9ACTN